MSRVSRTNRTITFVETVVVIILLAIFAGISFSALSHAGNGHRITCLNNLKQIGVAFRIWENDNGGKFPAEQTEDLGGMLDLLSNSDNNGRYAYLPFTIMQNEMGQSPRLVICPQDERTPNQRFMPGANAPTPSSAFPILASGVTGTFDNTNVSYFYAVGGTDLQPQSILAGDRNLCLNGLMDSNGAVRFPAQDPNYGLSGAAANPPYPCGVDATVNTNGTWNWIVPANGRGFSGGGQAVGWSAKMHSVTDTPGAGNILIGDGSAQSCTSEMLRLHWLSCATNDAAPPSIRGKIRLLIP